MQTLPVVRCRNLVVVPLVSRTGTSNAGGLVLYNANNVRRRGNLTPLSHLACRELLGSLNLPVVHIGKHKLMLLGAQNNGPTNNGNVVILGVSLSNYRLQSVTPLSRLASIVLLRKTQLVKPQGIW